MRLFLLAIILFPCLAWGKPLLSAPEVILPKVGLEPTEIGVVINSKDPISAAVGAHYIKSRGIPRQNVVTVSFPPEVASLDPAIFKQIKQVVDASLPRNVQALALTWTLPFRIGCMSVTSAFTFGYSEDFCATGCLPTKLSPLFGSDTRTPYDDYGIRPSMLIGAGDLNSTRALIDRGKASDASWPDKATAYLMDTSDRNRNVRHVFFKPILTDFAEVLPVKRYFADTITGRNDVLFYFTGLVTVPKLETNTFVAGAVADHLTSAGGVLNGKDQMNALRWIQAGATGSFGTVVEPCNFLEKFPNPYLLMRHYLGGENLVLAYWKSVAMPGQGVFLGDPLAAPFAGLRIMTTQDSITVTTYALPPDSYLVVASESGGPPFRPVQITGHGGPGKKTLIIHENKPIFYLVHPKKNG